MTDDAETCDRTSALRSLAAALDQSDVRARADEVLGPVVVHAGRLGMTVDAIARACGGSGADVEAWKSGAPVDAATASDALDAIRKLALDLTGGHLPPSDAAGP